MSTSTSTSVLSAICAGIGRNDGGIQAQSTFETPEGDDIEDINDLRDKAWSEWSEVADINGRLTLEEIQIIALREMVEAGEVLIRVVNLPSTEYRGISRPIPMALEIIEADRLATDRDTYTLTVYTKLTGITALKLEALTHPSLPGSGPGRGDPEQRLVATKEDPCAIRGEVGVDVAYVRHALGARNHAELGLVHEPVLAPVLLLAARRAGGVRHRHGQM
jgi:hypothetical protein